MVDTRRGLDYFHINLTSKEVLAVQAGEIVGDRVGLLPDSKVRVYPLSDLEPDDSAALHEREDYLHQADITPAQCMLDTDHDLNIFIPQITLMDVRTPGVVIPKDRIQVREGFEALKDVLPPKGVIVHFGGSIARFVAARTDV